MEWSWMSFLCGLIVGGVGSVVAAAYLFFKDWHWF